MAVHAQTLTAGDGTLIIFRISEFRKYLIRALGEPKLDKTSPYDDVFQHKKGIVAFSVHWANATGHIALWNGATYREPSHDNYATHIDPTNPKVRTSLGYARSDHRKSIGRSRGLYHTVKLRRRCSLCSAA